MSINQELLTLYNRISKHSSYQILPTCLADFVDSAAFVTKSRQEKERFSYITKNLNFNDRKILDIGANTGYFAFESISCEASHVIAYEGNLEHAAFIKKAAEAMGLSGKITVKGQYYNFDNINEHLNVDIAFLLNVLHHVGEDYGKKDISIRSAKYEIIKQLNSMSYSCKNLVFQLGFNWKGDTISPLFRNGTKKELIEFVVDGTKDYWEIRKIGIAEKKNELIKYADLNRSNTERNDSLGEFLNRPLFIMRSRLSHGMD